MKKWTNEELSIAIKEIKNGKSYEEISILLNRSFSSIRVKLIKEGFNKEKFSINKNGIKFICKNCGEEFYDKKSKKRKFCNHNCSATFNNKKRDNKVKLKIKNSLLIKDKDKIKNKKFCINCNKELTNKQSKYCSSKCQIDYQYNHKINEWKEGNLDGLSGKYGTSRFIKKFLIEKHGEKCMECGWNEINPYTGNIPIELEHIDGDFTNNKEKNLKLLCPNCHSLTKTYKGANRGKGRDRSKYY